MPALSEAENWIPCRTKPFLGWEVVVLTDPARLKAAVRLVPLPHHTEAPLKAAEVLGVLQDVGILPRSDFVERLTPALDVKETAAPVLIPVSEGTAPQAAQDGRIEWLIQCGEQPPAQSEDSQVDHYERSTLVLVRKDQRLFNITQPIPSAPGLDVFGHAIPVSAPSRPSFRLGTNVSITPDGSGAVADVSGRLLIRGDLVTVESTLRITTDVDFNVGNIDFPGDVLIGKSVLDDFRVHCGGNLTVRGNVEAAHLECAGMLQVDGGITGRERGKVKARGLVHAKYLNGAIVQGKSDIIVVAEILNSRVESLGRIAAGGVVGGEIIARNGVETGVLGSAMCVPTSLIVGIDYTIEGSLRRLREERAVLQREISAMTANVAPYMENPQRLAVLPPNRREQLKEVLLKLRAQRQQDADLEREFARLTEASRETVKASITVRRMLFAGVSVRIGACHKQFNEDIPGPIRLNPSFASEEICIDGLPPEERGS